LHCIKLRYTYKGYKGNNNQGEKKNRKEFDVDTYSVSLHDDWFSQYFSSCCTPYKCDLCPMAMSARFQEGR